MWTRTSSALLADAEARLLQSQGLSCAPRDVSCGDGNYIHTVEVKGSDTAKETVPIVLCHGYGLGVGAWTYNYEYLASGFKHVFAIDWLGCGRSSRPKFDAKGEKEAEAWFVDSLENWRESNKLEKLILCGHSLGGYLSVAYAEKYPQHIHRLILAGPVGIPEPPPDHGNLSNLPWKYRMLFGSVRNLWSWGVTPQQLIRMAGPWGKGVMEGYVQRRVRDNVVDKDLMSDYLYHVSAAPGSGEHALSEILLPGAWAKAPLCKRIPRVAEGNASEGRPAIPVSFVYGYHDWMDWKAARDVIREMPSPAREQSRVVRVPEGGHQVFMENPIEFCNAVFTVCGIDHPQPPVSISGIEEAAAGSLAAQKQTQGPSSL